MNRTVEGTLRQEDKLCRRCLLRDLMTPEQYAATVTRVRDALNPRLLVTDEEYARRLALCEACAHIQGGTCMRCGCLVEVRALRKDQHCPPPVKSW